MYRVMLVEDDSAVRYGYRKISSLRREGENRLKNQ